MNNSCYCYITAGCSNWPLELELRQPLGLFRPAHISLCHPAKNLRAGGVAPPLFTQWAWFYRPGRHIWQSPRTLVEVGQGRGTCTHPAGFTDPSANWLHYPLENGPHGGIRTRSEASSVGLHGENGGRRRTCSPGRFTSPISLAMSPGSLVRFTFPNWSPRKELHPDDEVRSLACCLLHHAEKYKVERRPGLAPGKNWFASSRLDGFGMRRLKEGTPGRICTGIDPV